MNVQDFTGDATELLHAAFANPKLNPKKNPDVTMAMRVVGETVARKAKEKIKEEVLVDLMDAVALYEVNNGEYEDIPEDQGNARDDYESGMDDLVEATIEKWEPMLSADWLGINTIETKLWLSTEDDRTLVVKLAERAAKEVYKQMTADKTPNQVLSNAGIVKNDVEAMLASINSGETTMTADATGLDGVIATIAAHVGKGFDQMAVYEDVECILEETDAILVGSAGERLGLNADAVEQLQIAAFALEEPIENICDLVLKYKAPTKKAKAAAAKKVKAEAAENALDPLVLANLKECGLPDTATAEALGVSRSTYSKYIKGTTPFSPDADQHAIVRGAILERCNMLLQSLSLLDGTELLEVS